MTRPDVTGARRRGSAGTGRGAPWPGASIALAVLATLALSAWQASPARAATSVGPQKTLVSPPTTIGFWAGESVPGTDWHSPDTYWNQRSTRVYTPHLWRVLRRYRIPLYFNLRYRRDFGPVPPGMPHRNDALRIIRTANRLGVPVWGWVLIPYSDGYWAWEGAAAEQFAAVRSLASWAREKRVRLEGLALDPEPPLNFPFQATAVTMGASTEFPPLFQQTIDPAAQCAAWHTYARIPRWAHAHGIEIASAPIAATLDDVRDGHLSLGDAGQFVLPKAPWDDLFFQAYRSVFSYFTGHDPGSGIVSSYFRSAQREFGEAGQISIGSTGRGAYRRLGPLLHDVRLAATLGATSVPIYSLERTVRAYGGPRSIIRIADAASHPFAGPRASTATEPTPEANALRATIRHADAAATAASPALTAARGTPQSPNAWPDACQG